MDCWHHERILCTKMSHRIPLSSIFPLCVLQYNSWHGNLICIQCFQDTHLQGQEWNVGVLMVRTDMAKHPIIACVGLDQSLEPEHCCCETHHFLSDNSQEAVFSSF